MSVAAKNHGPVVMKYSPTLKVIESFEQWIDSDSLRTYDWWDIWGSSYGQWSKGLFIKHKYLGAVAVMPVVLLDIFCPSFRKLFAKKRTYPISHAQVGLGYLNLYQCTGKKIYLEKALNLVDPLFKMASPLAKDLGWGMKHQWMTVQGLVPADTPCNTQTSYAYEFLIELYNITNEPFYLESLRKIAKHVSNDFHEWRDGDKLVSSYSTGDQRRVINANSYRMFMLIDAGIRFNDKVCLEKGIATLKYVLSKQGSDGSWVYSEDQDFVDGFHTCFVLKNLYKVSKILNDPSLNIERAIGKGLDYYCEFLIDKNDLPIPFSVKPRLVLYKYDLYDFAECIGLFADMNIKRKQTQKILDFVSKNFQTKKGWFSFRIYSFWPFKGIPYMRSANSAMFLALTKVMKRDFAYPEELRKVL